jgi:hypothetical protein
MDARWKFLEHATMAQVSTQISNKAIVQESLDRWKSGNGSPFELLIPEAEWTIVGSSPLSKTYHSRKEFLDEVGGPFDARVAKPPVRNGPGYICRRRHGHHPVRHRRHCDRRSTLS